jgi:hypothetical protein
MVGSPEWRSRRETAITAKFAKSLNFSIDDGFVAHMFFFPRNKRTGFMHGAGVLAGSGFEPVLHQIDDEVGFCLVLKELDL